ncbi:MAG: transglutaminase domain-containing protein [Lachnospiraceae bacterium]|nr:transglutaminase domain-containing protein [Lachnospiraceae bacterium]
MKSRKQKHTAKRKLMVKRKKLISLIFVLLFTICISAGVLIHSYTMRVYAHCSAEAGTEILAEDFLKNPKKSAVFMENSPEINNSVPGDYNVKIKSGIFTYNCVITIQDTIPPKADMKNVYIEPGETVTPEDFITEINDVTKVTASFVNKPDYSIYGQQKISVLLTDEGKNTSVYEVLLITRPTKHEITIEAGDMLPALTDFLLIENQEAKFVTSVSEMDTSQTGDYPIEISTEQTSYTTILHIQDTTAPELILQDVECYTCDTIDINDFVVSAEDTSLVTLSYVTKPDFTKTGRQPVTVRASDESGNFVEKMAVLTLKEDLEPPVINGVQNIFAYIGDKISYKKGITVSDNCDTNVELTVDTSLVYSDTEGDYPVTYTARDKSGNESVQTITLSLRERPYSQEKVDALADEVLAQIITENMGGYDKLLAIYNWIQNNVYFIEHSDKDSWLKAAYEGFTEHKGDCYVFACTAKALLTRAGIPNRDINKIPTTYQHFWNLVDIGEGWYHFDSCPRDDFPFLCYIDDATLMEISRYRDGYHTYDRTIFTDIK